MKRSAGSSPAKQKSFADELEERVAQRTAELTATIEQLKRELAERQRAKEALPITSKAATAVRMASIAGSMCLAYLYGMHKDASFIGFTCRSILMTVSELKKHYGLPNAI